MMTTVLLFIVVDNILIWSFQDYQDYLGKLIKQNESFTLVCNHGRKKASVRLITNACIMRHLCWLDTFFCLKFITYLHLPHPRPQVLMLAYQKNIYWNCWNSDSRCDSLGLSCFHSVTSTPWFIQVPMWCWLFSFVKPSYLSCFGSSYFLVWFYTSAEMIITRFGQNQHKKRYESGFILINSSKIW